MAIGIVFFGENGAVLHEYKECIGTGTNNEAEYRAIIKALEILLKSKWCQGDNLADKKAVCRLDSQLVVEQINGNWKIKQDHLKEFIARINELKSEMQFLVTFVHVRREQNKAADKLVNEALDEALKK